MPDGDQDATAPTAIVVTPEMVEVGVCALEQHLCCDESPWRERPDAVIQIYQEMHMVAMTRNPESSSTSYGVLRPEPVSAACPVDVRFLTPNGVELALHLEEMPRLGRALRLAGGNDPVALVREVAEAVAEALAVHLTSVRSLDRVATPGGTDEQSPR